MAVGIRTESLRKVFNTLPPVGGQGAPRPKEKGKPKPKAEVVALDDLTLEVRPGEIFGLLGPNGAGKSTTVGVLTTRVRPTAGRAWIGDFDVWQNGVAVKRLIGVVPQRPNLDFALTAREILTFHGAYFGLPSAERQRRADELLEQFKLTDRGNQRVLGFSGGMMQRLSIARAMMHDPEVLFLDEPSAGLDPQTRLLLSDMVRAYNARGKTILLTTHNMEEADGLCHRLAIVDHGKVIALGTPQDLKQSIPGGFVVRIHLTGISGAIPAGLVDTLKLLDGVSEVRTESAGQSPGQIDIYADRGGPLVPAVVGASSNAGATIRDLHIAEPSLENLFLHHTGRSLRE
jgi:ABC-2 type transport system ATP-binding protein